MIFSFNFFENAQFEKKVEQQKSVFILHQTVARDLLDSALDKTLKGS